MSICIYVCEVAKHPLPSVVETSGQRKPAITQFSKKKGGGSVLFVNIVKTRGFRQANFILWGS